MDNQTPSSNVLLVNGFLSTELRRSIYRFVSSRIKNRATAEDLTQDILISAARAQQSLRQADKLEAWVFRIARNRLNDYFRGRHGDSERFDENIHTVSAAGEPDMVTEEEAHLRRDLRHYIRKVVENLPPLYREALLATEFEGLSQVAYAKRAGISIPAAKSRVQRGRLQVRGAIEQCCEIRADCYGNIVEARPRQVTQANSSCGCR